MLSIGSGYSQRSDTPQNRAKIRPGASGAYNSVKQLYNIAVGHIESSLNAELAWRRYCEILQLDRRDEFRYQRLNVHLPDDPPKLDDVGALGELRDNARESMKFDRRLKQVAHHLIATSFFFEETGNRKSLDDGSEECHGIIHCRFTPETKDMVDFGNLLRSFIYFEHGPAFIFEELNQEFNAQQVSRFHCALDIAHRQRSFIALMTQYTCLLRSSDNKYSNALPPRPSTK